MYTLERFMEEMEKVGLEIGLEKGLEQGREEGIFQSLAQGRQEIVYKTVKGALKLGMDTQAVAETFEFDTADIEQAVEQIRREQA